MNVVVRIRLSQARRLVPGRNWWKAAYALTDVSCTRSSASVGLRVIRRAAGYSWLSCGKTSRSNLIRLSSSSVGLIPGSGGSGFLLTHTDVRKGLDGPVCDRDHLKICRVVADTLNLP